ncbi:unnamed protein product [Psylliodes chrysocephalus]|uniref:Cytochrome P450 n=1 Tax=Psylliodes chrysocephalus TaxID=3402493 RepID=A0A9P0CZ30_9CUCU|nr:unnamed protein product [Psylliodes chrysocephala]
MVFYQLFYYIFENSIIVRKLFITDNVYSKLHVQQNLWILLFTTLGIWYIKYLWSRRKLYWYSMNIPGPFGLPLIGSAVLFIGKESKILSMLQSIQQQFPGIYKLWMGPDLYFMVSDPKYIEIILNSPRAIEKQFYIYEPFAEILGDGLLTTNAKKWRHHRKTITPSFNQKILESFVDVFADKSKVFAEKISKLVGKKDVDWYILVSRCTLDTICETAMGINMNVQEVNECSLGECIEILMELANIRVFNVYYQNPLAWKMSKMKQEFDEKNNHFQNVISGIIRKKKEEFNLNQLRDLTYNEDGIKKKNLAFLDLLLENSDLTETELRAEIKTFVGAGTETSAASICAVFTVLGMFPDIQQKLYEEMVDILGLERDVTASDLPKMKYTERVIKETLRLFPVAPAFARTLTGDINLGDKILPSGCSVAFVVAYIHRNPEYWPDPLKFDPDRFLPEEVAKRHPCTYIPFSYGPRNCIGGRYAILNIKTVLATVIRQFKIFSEYKSIEEIELKLQMLLRFKDGYKVWLENR